MCTLQYLYTDFFCFFFFKQKTAYELRISDWSSDVCSSDLQQQSGRPAQRRRRLEGPIVEGVGLAHAGRRRSGSSARSGLCQGLREEVPHQRHGAELQALLVDAMA